MSEEMLTAVDDYIKEMRNHFDETFGFAGMTPCRFFNAQKKVSVSL
jgi:hypothetical protein